MALSDLYKCAQCGASIDPKGHATLRLVTGWVKGPSGKSVQHLEMEEFKYLHDWCLDTKKRGSPATGSLF